MKGTDLIPRLSRGFFLGAIVSALFWLSWPQVPSMLAAVVAFFTCAIISIVFGVIARSTVAGKIGLIGSAVLVVLMVGLNIVTAVVFYNNREALIERTLRLESSLQELGQKIMQETVEPAPHSAP